MNSAIQKYLATIGRRGGKANSAAKVRAARLNGASGGRPKKHRESSAYQVAKEVARGEDWKIAFMGFVDGFRRRPSYSLLNQNPKNVLHDPKMFALLQSICVQLCFEAGFSPKGWLVKSSFLPEPWFVSGVKNLYAMALKESPISFRRNNIFVLNNFLDRA